MKRRQSASTIPVMAYVGTMVVRRDSTVYPTSYTTRSNSLSLTEVVRVFSHPRILEPAGSGAYPEVSLTQGSVVTLSRSGGRICAFARNQLLLGYGHGLSISETVVQPPEFLNGPSISDWTLTATSPFRSDCFFDLPPASFVNTFGLAPAYSLVSQAITTGISASVSGDAFAVWLSFGRVANVEPPAPVIPDLKDYSTYFYTELPTYSLSIGGQTIPLQWAFAGFPQKTEEAGVPSSTKISNSLSLDVISGGLVVKRSSTGTDRRVVLDGGVSAVSCQNSIVRADGGLQLPSETIAASSSYGFPFDFSVQNLEVRVSDGGDGHRMIPSIEPSFTPAKIAKVSATLDGKVKSVGIEKAGGGFHSPPNVVFQGGGGAGATGTAIIEGGVSKVAISSGGSGYLIAPDVEFVGKGVHARATATINSQGQVASVSVSDRGVYRTPPTVSFTPRKTISSLSLTTGGLGYSSPPIVSICPNRGASASCKIDGSVVEVVVTSPGEGYSPLMPPAVTFSPPLGVEEGVAATGKAVVSQGGRVTGVYVTDGGRWYQQAPLITIEGSASALCRIEGPVGKLSLTSGGSNEFEYTPQVVFQGGGGTGAAATATLSASGGGASATAILDCGVIAVELSNQGSNYQYSPEVFFTGGDGGESAEALSKLNSGEITRKEYDSLPNTPIAQCRVEGFVSSLAIDQGGDYYSAPHPNSGDTIPGGVPKGIMSLGTERAFLPAFTLYGCGYRRNWNGQAPANTEPVPSDCLLAPLSYPGGPISLGVPIGGRSQLYHQNPIVAPTNGHLFLVDAVENARNVSLGLRNRVALTGYSRVGDENAGYSTSNNDLGSASTRPAISRSGRFRIDQISGKVFNLPIILGTASRAGGSDPLLLSGGVAIPDLAFSAECLFVLEDTDGIDAEIETKLNGHGKVESLSFWSEGSGYSDNTLLRLKTIPLPGSGCAATAYLLPGGDGVSHISVSSEGAGYWQPKVIVHGGGGYGCTAEAIKKDSGHKPGGVWMIEVTAPGVGYSQAPQVLIYDEYYMRSVRDAINDALKKYPLVYSGSGSAQSVFATFTSFRIVRTAHGMRPWLHSSVESGDAYQLRSFLPPIATEIFPVVRNYSAIEKYREQGDSGEIRDRVNIDTFSRFDRVKSVKYYSPPIYHDTINFRRDSCWSPYQSAPGLIALPTAAPYSQMLADCVLAVVALNPDTPAFDIRSGIYFAAREA